MSYPIDGLGLSIPAISISSIQTQEQSKVKTVDEALAEFENCLFVYPDDAKDYIRTGREMSQIVILSNYKNFQTDVASRSKVGTVCLPVEPHYCDLYFYSDIGKWLLKGRAGRNREIKYHKYDTLQDLVALHPLTKPLSIFDQPLTIESQSTNSGNVVSFIFKDYPVGSYIIRWTGLHNNDVLVKVDENNNYISLRLTGKTIPTPLNLSSLEINIWFSSGDNEQEKTANIAKFQQIIQQNQLAPIVSIMDFSRLVGIPSKKCKMYVDRLGDELKAKLTKLQFGYKGNIHLLALMTELAASYPKIKKILIPAECHYTIDDLTLESLEILENSLASIKKNDQARYHSLLLQIIPYLLGYKKSTYDAYHKNHHDVESSTKSNLEAFESGLFSDFSLIVEQQTIRVHRIFLAMFTDNLKEVLTSKFLDGKSAEKIIENHTYDIVKKALQYVYSGETLEQNFEDAFDLCKIADEWGIKKLKQRCEAVVVKNILQSTKIEENTIRKKVIKHIEQILFDDHVWWIWDNETQGHVLENLGKIIPYMQENLDEDLFCKIVEKLFERWKELALCIIKKKKTLNKTPSKFR